LGSGGLKGTTQTEKRRQVIDDIHTQIAKKFSEYILDKFSKFSYFQLEQNLPYENNIKEAKKTLRELHHAYKMEDLHEIYASINKLLGITKSYTFLNIPGVFYSKIKQVVNPLDFLNSDKFVLSPIVEKFIRINSLFFKQTEPVTPQQKIETEPITEPITPPYSINKPSEPVDIQTPSISGEELKRLSAAWEKILNNYGYYWEESENYYKNNIRDVIIKIYQDDSVKVNILSKNREIRFNNLGLLFRKLKHNKDKRHNTEKEPEAQLKENHFKDLFRFLYG